MDSLEDNLSGKSARNPLGISMLSFILGIMSVAMSLAVSQYIVGAIIGAVGLIIGGYAVNYANRSRKDPRWKMFVAFAGIGLMLSMVGFIYGFAAGL
jgi:hypothetical protein